MGKLRCEAVKSLLCYTIASLSAHRRAFICLAQLKHYYSHILQYYFILPEKFMGVGSGGPGSLAILLILWLVSRHMVVGARGLQSEVGPRALTFPKLMPTFAHIVTQASKTSGKTRNCKKNSHQKAISACPCVQNPVKSMRIAKIPNSMLPSDLFLDQNC